MQKDSLQNRNGVVKTVSEWEAEASQEQVVEAPVEETSTDAEKVEAPVEEPVEMESEGLGSAKSGKKKK